MLTWQTLRLHAKPVCLLNTAGFYDGLLFFLDHAVREGILRGKARATVLVAASVDEALDTMQAWRESA